MKNLILTILVASLFIVIAISPTINSIEITSINIKGFDNDTKIIDESLSENLFDAYIKILMKIGHRPSIATGIIYNDSLVWSKGYGYYDLENQKEATTDTLYLQASVSKTIVATALMQQYEQEKFNLTDDISDYLPFTFRNPNHPNIPITIEMVMSHRSSLADDNLYWICLSYLPGDPDIPDCPMPWLEEYFTPNGSAYSSSTWSDAEPGEEYYYSNVGYSLIAYLVEVFSGQNFNEYCKEHIFEPLEMYNSSFRLKDHNISNIAVPYEYIEGGYFRHPHYGIYPIYPAITLRTSVEEFSHFLIAHMNEGVWNGIRILDNTTVDLMHKAHFSPEDKYNYGLGWTVTQKVFGETEIGHSGGYVGALDLVTIRPDKDIAVIFFSNELDAELHASRTERFAFNKINNALMFKALRIAR
jgi:CubicO group peptidase (beta-lactamase class C family)